MNWTNLGYVILVLTLVYAIRQIDYHIRGLPRDIDSRLRHALAEYKKWVAIDDEYQRQLDRLQKNDVGPIPDINLIECVKRDIWLCETEYDREVARNEFLYSDDTRILDMFNDQIEKLKIELSSLEKPV